MKVPLEPIPTEQIVLVEKNSHRATIKVDKREQGSRPDAEMQTNQLDKAYPWLLGASTCLSVVLCWMYVTKPVISQQVQASGDPALQAPEVIAEQQRADNTQQTDTADQSVSAQADQRDLVPSDNRLPGTQKQDPGDLVSSSSTVAAKPVAINPGQLVKGQHEDSSGKMGLGWESTNLKVQHILSADSGNGDLEKIVIDVPVLYQTRTMRWTSEDVSSAREVMARLMVYERNLSNLRREGQAILKDWNSILENSVPAPALRADSPSLPYNHSQSGQSADLPGSSSVIKVEP